MMQGAGFRVQGSWFRVQGAGCRVQGAGFRVQGAGSRVQGAGCRLQGVGWPVQQVASGVTPCYPGMLMSAAERGGNNLTGFKDSYLHSNALRVAQAKARVCVGCRVQGAGCRV